MLVERWLFFVEAKHTVTLYYGGRRGSRAGHDNVIDARPARQVADRFGEALQERPVGPGVAQPLGQLVADIGRVKIGEDEHIRPAGDLTGFLELLLGDRRDNRSVHLKLAVNLELWRPLASEG